MTRPVASMTREDGVAFPSRRSTLKAPVAFLAVAAVLVALAVGAAPARADFGVSVFDGGTFGPPPPGNTDAFESGPAYTQAGGHPYEAWTAFQMNRVIREFPRSAGGTEFRFRPDGGNLRNVRVDLPPGLIGNPTAVPQCPRTRRMPVNILDVNQTDPEEFCTPASVLGLALITFDGGPDSASDPDTLPEVATNPAVVFNLEPPPGVAASFGFTFQGSQAFLDARLRADGEYAISVHVRNANNAAPVLGVRVALWGVPADPSHDFQRCIVMLPVRVETAGVPTCDEDEPGTPLGPNPFPSHLERKAFLTLPTACTPPGVGLETRMHVEPWDPASPPADASFISHLPPGWHPTDHPDPSTWGPPQGPTGCDRLPFDPSFSAQPDSSTPDSPSGLTVNLGFPQEGLDDPEGLGTAHLRDTSVTLPEGMTINPSGADGLAACTDAQVDFASVSPVACPEASKIATVTATTPVLEEHLTGAVYVGSQLSDDPESGDMFRIILALENVERGIFVKLLGKVRADSDTGRLETTFAGNPQLPVSSISLHFKDGPRAPLAMPPDCGTKTVNATMSSWAGHLVQRTDSFNIACTPDLGGFLPSFSAGTVTPTGGAFSPFVVRINRPDRQQYVRGLTIEMPPGLIGRLKDIPLCPEAQANAGTCGIESRIGTATVGAGPGTNPFFLQGSVSLTGGYKGAPFGLSTAVRAVAGPFDLGMVVVRQSIFVDPVDAHITVVSDPLPLIVKGVPVRLRSINVDVNRPGFTLNPTSCGPKQIKATLVSDRGAIHQVTQPFQVGDCQALPLRPRLRMRLTGRKQLRDKGHPGVRAVLTQAPGQANLKRVQVKLPLSLALDPERAQSDDLCEFEAGLRVACPPSSIIGRARAFTPVLNRPLTGPVYFVKNVRIHPRTGNPIRTLPTLLIPLKGEVDIHLRAQSDTQRGKLVNTFSAVPDAPVSRFELTLRGGRDGILIVNGNPCRRSRVADVLMDGQNGKRADRAIKIGMPCAKRKRAALSVASASWRGNRLTVSGRVAKAATRRIRVAAACGRTTVSTRAKPRRGRWKATLTLRGQCAGARRARVTVRYPGGPKVRGATAARRVSKRG
jgi:hypothetical protein